MYPTVKSVLIYLEDAGWSDLIDSRWKKEVIRDIKQKFPNISQSVLDEVLKLVLV